MRKIDLHMHTLHSDGVFTTKELMEKAENEGLSLISITDHNKVGAYFDLQNEEVRSAFSGEIVCGTEIYSIYNNVVIEILAYDFDVLKMKNFLETYFSQEMQKKLIANEAESVKNNAIREGLKFDDNYDPQKQSISIFSNFFNHLKTFPENAEYFKKYNVSESKVFYRNFVCNKNSKFFFDYSSFYPTINVISDFVHSCGGKVFLAHPYMYFFEDKLQSALEIARTGKLDGLEAFHSSFNKEETDAIVELCKRENLLICGGSDYHGSSYRNERLGHVIYGEYPLDYSVFEKLKVHVLQ